MGTIDVTALSNGNYVVCSQSWDNGAINSAGAATWGDGTTGTVGVVSAANSLVGSTESDQVGFFRAIALSNGNYVVSSPNWDNGAVTNAGAATWGNGTTGTVGTVSAENSLVGSNADDQVGTPGVTALSNGNYVVNSRNWDNGVVSDAGASTWANGTTGLTGAVSAANSLVGSKSSDFVGFHLAIALTNGNYVVRTQYWDNGAVWDVGAATWGNGTTGTVGTVSAENSLVGSIASDGVGNNKVVALSDGNYVVYSTTWKNVTLAYAGAVTLSNGTGGTVGTISADNSVLGTVANGSTGLAFSYDASSGKLLVGQPSAKQVSIFSVNVPRSHQELWRFTNFGSYDSVASGADSADPDDDGLNNLLEYALGIDPNASGMIPATLALNGTNLEYTYTRSTAAKDAGVTYQVLWSDTLEVASWSAQDVTEQITSTEGALETVKATVPKGSGGKRFMRLQVTGPAQ